MKRSRKCGKFSCIYGKWNQHPGASILCMDCTSGVIIRSVGLDSVLVSGGFAPLHVGHLSNFAEAADLGDLLIVVVNGDKFLEKKRGRAFMPLEARCQIVSRIVGVDIVVPFEPTNPDDATVCEALEVIHPDIFAKGGDRNKDNIPEAKVCEDLGINLIDGVGAEKLWSSSDYLNEWGEFYFKQEQMRGGETQ